MIIQNGPLIPKKILENGSLVSKKPDEFNAEDFRLIEKNAKAKKIYILALVLMSILSPLSASQPKKFGMLSK